MGIYSHNWSVLGTRLLTILQSLFHETSLYPMMLFVYLCRIKYAQAVWMIRSLLFFKPRTFMLWGFFVLFCFLCQLEIVPTGLLYLAKLKAFWLHVWPSSCSDWFPLVKNCSGQSLQLRIQLSSEGPCYSDIKCIQWEDQWKHAFFYESPLLSTIVLV